MDNLLARLTELGQETCALLADTPFPTRDWNRYIPTGESSASSLVEQRPDTVGVSISAYFAGERAASRSRAVDAVLADAVTAARVLVDTAGQPVGTDSDRRSWVIRMFLHPLLTNYFLQKGSFTYQGSLFEKLARDHVADLVAEFTTVTARTPLLNLRVGENALDIAPGVKLRRLQPDELEKWLNPGLPIWGTTVPGNQMTETRSIGEVTEVVPAPGFPLPTSWQSKSLLLIECVRLATNGEVFPLFTEVEAHGGPRIHGTQTTPYPIPPLSILANPTVLDDRAAAHLPALWTQLHPPQAQPAIGLARRRWLAATEKRSDEDRLIDSWIGIESIFAHETGPEAKYRSSLRIATFLREPGADRVDLFRDIQTSYDWRSAIVHGGMLDSSRSEKLARKLILHDAANLARNVLREAILKIAGMDTHFGVQSLDEHILGGR